ncbi:MAG TPA: tRNA pseudouridine(13) synthase TruD [Candidatus Nanoarchaeia archaeon]|nr:tRNA pseudouridine(13) synthase TruD [Candidatus Nanoarchaeia archaeon]
MYTIKKNPEDFVVKEITDITPAPTGEYTYFLLKKRNYNTLSAIEVIAKILNVPLNRFGFAGNKDKQAVTEQLISARDVKKVNLEKISLTDIEIIPQGYGDNYISLGSLKGNEFTITVRNISKEERSCFDKKKLTLLFPNTYGEQRFSEKNVDVGRALIKRDFEEASSLLNLSIVENDFIGAIRQTNKKILRLYIHAYQSFLFNEIIMKYLKKKREQQKIPILGFGTELERYPPDLQAIAQKILEKEHLTLRDFITVKMPELSEEGTERDLYAEIENLKILREEADTLVISFFLKKGSYATEAIKFLFQGS